MERKPIIIMRVAITIISDLGFTKSGGYFTFKKPSNEDTPKLDKVLGKKSKGNEKVLWCPYCGEWTVFEKEYEATANGGKMYSKGTTARWYCQGSCHWSHTEDFSVRKENNLWLS